MRADAHLGVARQATTRAPDFNSPIWLKVTVPLNGSGSAAAVARTALTVT